MATSKVISVPSVYPQDNTLVSRRPTCQEPQVIKKHDDLQHVLEEVLDLRETSDIYDWVNHDKITSVSMLLSAGKHDYKDIRYPCNGEYIPLHPASQGNL